MTRSFYEHSPGWLQGLLVDIVALRAYKRKYGTPFRLAYGEMEMAEAAPREEMLRRQRDRLRGVLEFAAREVPYYSRLRLAADDISSWPVLEKGLVAREADSFMSPAGRARGAIWLHTSGTTGTPLSIRCTPEAYQREMAFRWRHRVWAGLTSGARGAYVAGHPVVPASQRRPPFWRQDHVEGRLLMSSYHLGPDTLAHYLRALIRFEPDFIHGYPSSLHLLAGAAQDTGLRPHPRAVFSASETLHRFQRERIEAAFGAKVYNWYGQTELTCNIVECREGGLHVRTDYGFLEILDDGSMLCTGFINRAMPLIRYRTGDRAEPLGGECGCGCAFPLIARVEGRAEDYVVTGDGYLVGRLDHLFKEARGVLEAQLLQERIGEVVVRVVRGPGYGSHSEAIIHAEAMRRLGERTRIRFDYPTKIERGPGGKFRFVVSQIGEDWSGLGRTPGGDPDGHPLRDEVVASAPPKAGR